jgi:hypothetical protein
MTLFRLGLALAGFALALLSIAFNSRVLGWVAIGALGGSLLARLVARRREKAQTR